MASPRIHSPKITNRAGAALAAVYAIFLSAQGFGQSKSPATTRPAHSTTHPAKHPTTRPSLNRPSRADELNALREKAMQSIKSPEGGYPTTRPTMPPPKPALHVPPKQPPTGHATPPAKPMASPSRPMAPSAHPAGKPMAGVPGAGRPGQTPPVLPDNSSTTAPAGIENTQTTLTFTIAPIDPEARTYRFDYVNTAWGDVLADFSRMSGLSFLNQPDPPITEALTFHSPRDFTYKEALDQLNELLTSRPLNKYVIQREARFLTIDRLPDAMRKIPPSRMFASFDDMEKANLGQFDVALVNMEVPEGWSPYEIIEKFRVLLSDTYGTQVNGEKLELTGQVWEHHRFRDLIKTLAPMSKPEKDDPRVTMTIDVKNARVADLQTMLRQIFPGAAPAAPGRGPGVDPKMENAKRIDILADIKNNRLMIKAMASMLPEIADMVAKLDTGSGPTLPEMKVIKLEFADANQLSATLKQMFMKEQQALMRPDGSYVSPEMKANLERDIFPDPASNSVILVGGKEGLAKAEAVVKEWDTPAENQITEVVELKNADSNTVSATLMNVFPPTGKGGVQERIVPRTNTSLLVSCSRQSFEKIRSLVEKLDVPPDDDAKEHVVQPKAVSPTALAQILQQAMNGSSAPRAQVPGQRGVQPSPPSGPGARIIPDDATGFLFVYCNDKEWEKAEPLIKKIDEQAVVVEPKLRSFILKRATAEDVAAMLRQMFGAATPGGKAPGAAPQELFFADTYNNAVQIFASDEFLAKVAPFIEQLDVETGGELTVIKLAHAKADAIVSVLAQTFPGSAGTPVRAMSGGGKGPPPAQVAPGGGGVRIVPEPITNSLLVTAPAKELAQIKQLVDSMEAAAEAQAGTRVIMQCKHRPSAELAETLRSLAGVATRPTGKITSGSGAVSNAYGADALNIVAAGNQIILDGPRDDVAKSIQLFEQIDVPYEEAIYRKYAVQDASEDEKKLRAMLAMKPAPAKPEGGKGGEAAPQQRLAVPEAIQIVADTYENTLLIAAKSESDFKVVESVLTLLTHDPINLNPEEVRDNKPFFLITLKNKDAFDISFTVEDLVNPDRKSGGIKLEEGPTKKTLLVKNCKPSQRAMVEEYVALFDVPDTKHRQGFRTIDTDKMPPEVLVRLLQRNAPMPIKVVDSGDVAGRVQVIDIHAGEPEEPEAKPEEKPGASANPCVLPASLLRSLAAVAMGPTDDANCDEGEPLEPAVCPICHQSPCVLPAELLKSLDAVSMAGSDDEPSATTRPASAHNHPVTESRKTGRPDIIKEAVNESGPPTILVDPDTGKLIIMGREEDLDTLEEFIDDITYGEQPIVFRKFPLKYSDVATAGQLLETIFNQGTASKKSKSSLLPPTPQPMPVPQPGQPGQPGQPQKPGQPGQPPQQPVQVQPAAPSRIKVFPDTRTRSLFVAAPLSDIPLVIDILKQIDSKVEQSASNVKIFCLEKLDATQVVENLKEVFDVPTSGRGGRGGQRGGQPNRPGQPQGQPNQAQQQQVLQMQGGPGQGVVVSSEDTISLTADPQTNCIIAKAPLDVLDLAANLIDKLEKNPNNTETQMRRVPLKNARATDIAGIVKDVTAKMAGQVSGGPGNRSARTNPGISVNADSRTNSVILAGQAKDIEKAVEIIEQMDSDQSGGTIRQFAVKGDPNTISTALKSLFVSGQQSDIVITADASSGTVLVKAPGPQMTEIAEQIDAMEEKIATSTDVRMIKLMVANAETVAEKMQAIFADARGKSGGKQNISIKGNKSNSTLYVSGADNDIFKTIESVAHDMDKAPLDFMVKSFPLKYASAVDVNQKLTEMMLKATQTKVLEGAKLDLVGVVPDARTNSLVVTGGPITFGFIGSIIDQIDQEAKDTARYAQTYTLPPSVDATQVAANIQALFASPTAQSMGQEPPAITANPGANVVIVNATERQHKQIKEEVVDPLLATVGTGLPETRFVVLKHGKADEVARAMMESLKATAAPNARGQWPINVTPDPASNTIMVTAPSNKFEEVDKMIAALDTAGEGVRKESTIELTNTSPADVARSLQQVFTASVQGKAGRTPPTIQEVPGSTRLVVLATDSELEQIKNLVQQIDVEGSKGRMVHTVTMPELIPAKTVAETIKQLFGSTKEDGVKAEYHEPTNTLLVRATEAEFERIKSQVIDKVSETPTIGALKIFKIPLKYAVADEVAKTLQDFFDKKSGVTRGNNNLPPWMRGNEPPSKQADNQVSIVAEASSNMLLVYCTDATKEMIDGIIADIDSDVSAKNTMEMVALKYMSAEDMLGIMTEYLKVSKRSPGEENKRVIPWWMDAREEKSDDKTVLAGDMRLKAVETLNAIIVVGKPEAVTDAVNKIKELDVESPESGDTPQRIELAHVSASEIADTLTKVFNDPNVAKTKGKSYVPPVIVAQDATNSIIVKAKANEFNLIKKMAENMDSEMKEEDGRGVRLLQVSSGQNVDELATLLEKSINDSEKNRQQVNKEYKPRIVSIGADPRANVLLVSGTKSQYEQVEALAKRMAAMGPTGGIKRVPVILKSMTSQQAKQLIETIQKGPQNSGSKGPRSDADWSRTRRPVRKFACAMSIPAFLMQATLSSAIGQTKPQPTTRPAAPVISTIRPRTTPARKPAPRPPAKAPVSRPATTRPTAPKSLTPEEIIRAKAAESGGVNLERMTDSAREAFRKKLSGAPISVAEAGDDTIVIEGNEGDVDVLLSVLDMLDTVGPTKDIEYVTLKNASAKDLAKTLADVFQKTEQVGSRKVKPEDKVDIIADQRTNGLYIAATKEKMAQVLELVRKNEESAPSLSKNVKTYVLKNRRVMEGGEVLKKMVASYLKQKGLDPNQISVELDPQTNSILVTAGESDLAFVDKVITGLDAELPPSEPGKTQPIGESDVMVVPLRIAQADTLGTLLNELLKKAATGDTPMKDFIRRFRLLDEKGNPLATVNLDRPIYIVGDKDSNSLIIASTRDNCLIMKQVAAAFDKEPARAEVEYKVFTLKYADASDVAEAFSKLITDAEALTQRPGKGEKSGVPEGDAGPLVYKAVVTSDPRTNQVVVVARPDAMSILGDMIAKMDIQGLDVMPFEIVKLEYASPTGLQEALNELVKQRAEALPKGKGPNADKAEKIVIIGDVRSRSLIIAAKQARREELRDLIRKLDVPATALIEDIRTITLRKASAADMADKLKKLWEDRQKQQDTGTKGMKLEIPAIVADERSNSLVIAASKGDYDAIKSVVEKIEALELNPMSNIYVIRLKYNSAKQLQTAMKALFDKRAEMRGVDGKSTRPEDKVEIQVDEVSNSLLMVGSRENYEVLEQKVKELDLELGVPGQVEFFVCTNVGAHRVKDTIDSLFKDGVYKPGGAPGGDVGKAREKVNVSVDDRSNMLIVSASPENMEMVREVYKRMNSVATPWDVAITKMIIIEHGDSVKIAAQVQDYFEKLDKVRDTGGDSKSKSGFGITIFADERSNRVVIGGTKDGIDAAVELVKKMDVPPGTPGQLVEVYKLTEAPAAKIAEIIDKVFKERNKPRGGDTGTKVENVPVIIQSESSTNSLLINASREDHILLKELISRLDRPSTLLEMVKVIPLEKAPASRVKEILEELYKSGSSGGGGGDSKSGGGGSGIAVVEDTRTNSVVITAPPGELENITTLVKRLDETEVKGQAEVGIFHCENEDAVKMADLLNSIMTGQAVSGGSSRRSSSSSSSSSTSSSSGGGSSKDEEKRDIASMLISLATKDERGREIFLKTIRENVQITSNERTNSVIVVAPPSSLKLIEQLIRELDQIQKRPVMVKVFVLRNADATKMIDLLDKMFAQEEGAEDQAAFQRGREITVEGGTSATLGVPEPASAAGEGQKGTFGRPKTTFVADERTNTLIVAGWPEDIDVVADVIDQLDSRPIQDRENIVYSLVNQKAEDVQSALDAYFQAETQRLDTLGETVSPQRRMEQEVSIIAHEPSNQLILSVSPRYKQQVLSIIEQIDTAPPQVMIQVMIAEVTLDDRFEMGLEFALQQLRFSETATADANGILQSSHFDVVGGTDLGAAGTGLGGFSFTLTGEDFNFLVRALQSDSRLEVIQRPMIMCQDNQQATIQIGQSVPTPTGSQAFAGQTSTQVNYQDVGVILNVEPHINPDGFVYMLVEPEVSSVSASSLQIAPGAFAPIINQRRATTYVAVKDGETVVIGGLITTTETEAEAKVPLLGDIPGLGILFRSTTRTKNKTELLIAMTPKVVRTVEDGRRISIEKRDESGIITDNMKQSPLMEGLQLKPEDEQEISSLDLPPESAEPGAMPASYEPVVPVEPVPGQPPVAPPPTEPSKPKYGPEVPKYGPMVPASEDTVARR